MMSTLFSHGTSRVGQGGMIWSFSLPPGRAGTCVGATELCNGVNYDRLGRERYTCSARRIPWPGARKKWYKTWKHTLTEAFKYDAVWELHCGRPNFVRVHPTGDFYDVEYVKKWIYIVSRCPSQYFWAYTRSWRLPKILKALEQLAAEPNMSLFWSVDSETEYLFGPPPHVAYVRVAYLRVHPEEEMPNYVDLVWKDKRGSMHPEPGLFACPQGIKRATSKQVLPTVVTCSQCRWCLRRRPSKRDRGVV